MRWGHGKEDGELKEKNKTKYTMYPCNETTDTSIWGKYAEAKNFPDYWCTDVLNNTLKGSFADTDYWYSQVKLNTCDNQTNVTCAN